MRKEGEKLKKRIGEGWDDKEDTVLELMKSGN